MKFNPNLSGGFLLVGRIEVLKPWLKSKTSRREVKMTCNPGLVLESDTKNPFPMGVKMNFSEVCHRRFNLEYKSGGLIGEELLGKVNLPMRFS